MGSWVTRERMRASRISRFVAEVSSSMSSSGEPSSTASLMAAAWDVEPEAFAVEKAVVSAPPGRPPMKGEMSTSVMERPSAARIFMAFGVVATSSLPSPGMWA